MVVNKKLAAGAALVLLAVTPTAAVGKPKPKPKPTKTQILTYSDDEGNPSKRIFTGKFFSMKGICQSDGRPQIVVAATVDNVDVEQVHVGEPSDTYSRTADGLQKGQKSANTLPAATGQMIVQGPKASQLAVISDVYHPSGFGSDCSYSAALTLVGKKDVISATTDSSKDLRADGPLDLELNCSDPEGTIDLAGPSSGALGVDHLTNDGFRQSLVPLSDGETLFGPMADLGDAVYVGTSQSSTGYRLRMKPSPVVGDPCTASGLASTDKQSIYYEADAPAARAPIHTENGLTLSALCASDQMEVFASTTKPGSLLTQTSLSDADEFSSSQEPFSNTEASPSPVLSIQDATQSGQLAYVRPDGKMVAIDYLASNLDSDCLLAGVSWTAKR